MASTYEEMMKTAPYLPLIMGDCLPEAIIAKAQKELGETEEVKAKTIPELRQLVQAEPDFICPTDDAYLLQFLRVRKFKVQNAFSLLKNFYKVKKSNPDMYGSFDKEVLQRMYDQKSGFFLPYRDEDGCAVGIVRMQMWDLELSSAADAVLAITVAALWAAQEPVSQICGLRMLIDARGASLKQIRSLVPRQMILLAKGFTNTLPIRFKGLHFYHESPILRPMLSVLRLFLTEKIKNRIYLHGDSQNHLHKSIPKEIFPAAHFGGDNPNDVPAWFNAEIVKYYETFSQLITWGYRQ